MNTEQANLELEKAPTELKYTLLGRFEKLGREIDPDRSWNKCSKVGFNSKNSDFEIISGGDKHLFVSAIRELEGEKRKTSCEYFLKNNDDYERIQRVLKNSLPVFSSANRAQLFINLTTEVGKLLKENPNYTSEELELRLVNCVLDSIPVKPLESDQSAAVDLDLDDFFNSRLGSSEDRIQTRNNIKELIVRISKCVDEKTFQALLESFKYSSNFAIFDENYDYSLVLKEQWLNAFYLSRSQSFDSLESHVPVFQIRNQISNNIETRDQLKNILSNSSFEKIPDYVVKSGAVYQEELVEISSVVGMSGCDSWIIQDLPGSDKGLDNIWNRVSYFKNNDLRFSNEQVFIKAIRINGKIYIHEDGRNRFAALKALGIKQIPLLVIDGELVSKQKNSINSII